MSCTGSRRPSSAGRAPDGHLWFLPLPPGVIGRCPRGTPARLCPPLASLATGSPTRPGPKPPASTSNPTHQNETQSSHCVLTWEPDGRPLPQPLTRSCSQACAGVPTPQQPCRRCHPGHASNSDSMSPFQPCGCPGTCPSLFLCFVPTKRAGSRGSPHVSADCLLLAF